MPEIDPAVGFLESGRLFRASVPSGRVAVELALTRQSIMNEFVLGMGTRSATDWIITLPTKRFHHEDVGADPFTTAYRAGTRDVEAFVTGSNREGGDGASESASYAAVGLPALGFMLRTFRNGTLECGGDVCQGNCGGLFNHKWRQSISPR